MHTILQLILIVSAAFLVHLGGAAASESKTAQIVNRLKELDRLISENDDKQ